MEFKLLGVAPTIKLLDTTVKVNNKASKIVRVTWKAGVYDYYFTPDYLTMNPVLYTGYIYDGWYGFLNLSHCLPVKIVKSYMGYAKIIITLEKVSPRLLEHNVFNIPTLTSSSETANMSFLPNVKYKKLLTNKK